MQLIGHRGASGHYPENTLLSFQKAFEFSCDGIELDIQATRDGEIVVIHDWTLERTSNGKGLVSESTLKELKALDFGSWFNDQREDCKNIRISTLEEVLEIVPRNKIVNIEIKELFSIQKISFKTLSSIIHNYPQLQIVVSSFSHNLLSEFHKIAKSTNVALLMGNTLIDLPQYVDRLGFDIYSYHPYVSLLMSEEVEIMHSRGIKVYPWTVNSLYDLEACIRTDVDGIITNYPRILESQENTC